MVRPLPRNSILGIAISLALWPTAISAHTVKASKTVAVTFHLEPDHNPRAGSPAQVWFLLTQKGGGIIPLAQCDCTLQVYSEQDPDGKALLKPPLAAISAEQYQNIPGTEVIFPQPGAYRLVFQGRPQKDGRFEPFQFSFPVTVAKGASVPAPPSSQPLPSAPGQSVPSARAPQWVWKGIGFGVGVGLLIWARWQRSKR